jgi:glycosyltransferase involved in cell wall biosynthesis
MVHVDFNLINNLHTYGFFPDKSIFINNFSSFELNKHEIDEKSKSWKNKQKLKLLFPRRLQIIRGTRILPSVVKYLEEKKIDYQLTICGEGPDVSFLESQFKNNVRIKLIIGESENEMKRIYSDHDVVLVPSIASEGTSISAIEGMATGCVVLASEVGGLSNIIIDNYNGIICSSNNHLTFAHAIEKLLQNKSFAVELIEQAYKVYKTSFTKELWQNKWMEVIKNHKSINQLEL